MNRAVLEVERSGVVPPVVRWQKTRGIVQVPESARSGASALWRWDLTQPLRVPTRANTGERNALKGEEAPRYEQGCFVPMLNERQHRSVCQTAGLVKQYKRGAQHPGRRAKGSPPFCGMLIEVQGLFQPSTESCVPAHLRHHPRGEPSSNVVEENVLR